MQVRLKTGRLILVMRFFVYIINILAVNILFTVITETVESNAAQLEDNPVQNHLSKAIDLYQEGKYDKSFNELTAQIEETRFCALAYYYRARIRVIKKKYNLALKSLEAAFRDSTDFADAIGLHAYILKETGKDEEALEEWQRFVEAKGLIGNEDFTIDSIILPEEYREKLNRFRTEQNKSEEKEPDSLVVQEIKLKEKETTTQTWKNRIAKNQLPIAITDISNRMNIKSAEEETYEKRKYVLFSLPAALIIVFLAGLTIIYLILRNRKRLTHASLDIITEIEEPLIESSDIQFENEGKNGLSEMGPEHINLFPGSPVANAMKLMEIRKIHAREINRLMKKL